MDSFLFSLSKIRKITSKLSVICSNCYAQNLVVGKQETHFI